MTEAEIVLGLLTSGQTMISLFSMFFTMISAYIAGLYFFLNRAPLALRLLAFFLLSIGLVFLGTAAAIQQRLQEGLATAWAKLPSPILSVEVLRNPVSVALPYGLSFQEIGTLLGWVTALCVNLALGYMTFIFQWNDE